MIDTRVKIALVLTPINRYRVSVRRSGPAYAYAKTGNETFNVSARGRDKCGRNQ